MICRSFVCVLAGALMLTASTPAHAQSIIERLLTVGGEVTVRHEEGDQWLVSYDLTKDIYGIMLGPRTQRYHDSAWVLPEGFRIRTSAEGYAIMERADKAPFRELHVQLSTWRDYVVDAPQPFAELGDGVAINTDPLGYAAVRNKRGRFMHFKPHFRFETIRDEEIQIPGRGVALTPSDSILKPGLVYFGSSKSIQRSADLHLLTNTHDELNAFLWSCVVGYQDYYNTTLGEVLDTPLAVMFSAIVSPVDRDGAGEDRDSMKLFGVAQKTQFLVRAFSSQPLRLDDETKSRLQEIFAHEMAHIWQADLGNGSTMQWQHEGGAELLSWRAMQANGLLDDALITERLNERIDPAIADLRETQLLDASVRHPELNYTAGVLVMAAAEASTAADGTPNDIIDIERVLQDIAPAKRMHDPLGSLLATLEQLGATASAREAIAHFISERHPDPEAALNTLFAATALAHTRKEGRLLITLEPHR